MWARAPAVESWAPGSSPCAAKTKGAASEPRGGAGVGGARRARVGRAARDDERVVDRHAEERALARAGVGGDLRALGGDDAREVDRRMVRGAEERARDGDEPTGERVAGGEVGRSRASLELEPRLESREECHQGRREHAVLGRRQGAVAGDVRHPKEGIEGDDARDVGLPEPGVRLAEARPFRPSLDDGEPVRHHRPPRRGGEPTPPRGRPSFQRDVPLDRGSSGATALPWTVASSGSQKVHAPGRSGGRGAEGGDAAAGRRTGATFSAHPHAESATNKASPRHALRRAGGRTSRRAGRNGRRVDTRAGRR